MKQNDKSISEFSMEFLDTWMDSEYLPSIREIKKRNWNSLPVADYLNPMESEWLAEAINDFGVQQVVGLSFEYRSAPNTKIFNANRDTILEFNNSNSNQYVCLTSVEVDFFYFKDDANRFFLLCGNKDFIKTSYKCSKETARMMYFDYWVESDFNSQEERNFLTRIWEKYADL